MLSYLNFQAYILPHLFHNVKFFYDISQYAKTVPMSVKNKRPCLHCSFPFDKSKSRCPECRCWNIEPVSAGDKDGVTPLSQIDEGENDSIEFIETGPWDPCFGRLLHDDGSAEYGIPNGSVTLLGGKNGAGKSTLVLQICDRIAERTGKSVLIVSVEEAKRQVRRLGKRLKLRHMDKILMSRGEVSIDGILQHRKPAAIFVDSLPRLCPDLGDAVEFCKRLKDHVAAMNIPAIVINHINKEEEFAGLEALQHEVDATLIFTIFDDEIRELRSLKNRNGELARRYFNMTDTGLVETFLDDENEDDE